MKFWVVLGVVALLLGPGAREQITRPSADISFDRGVLRHRGLAFTGTVVTRLDGAGVIRYTSYARGRMHGNEVDLTLDGTRVAERSFWNDVKSGVHRAWFPSGARRSYFEYRAGKPQDEAWEWFESGHPSAYLRFEDGKVLGKKYWREDGQIYSNHVFAKGKATGLPGAKLCFQVRGEPE